MKTETDNKKRQAFHKGWDAYGKPIDNPFVTGTPEHELWFRGLEARNVAELRAFTTPPQQGQAE